MLNKPPGLPERETLHNVCFIKQSNEMNVNAMKGLLGTASDLWGISRLQKERNKQLSAQRSKKKREIEWEYERKQLQLSKVNKMPTPGVQYL